MKKVAVIMGSDGDLPVVEKCIDELRNMEYRQRFTCTRHRTPDVVNKDC